MSDIHGYRDMRALRQPNRETGEMRLLQPGHLLPLHKEPEEEEDRPSDNLQELLVEYGQEKALQERQLIFFILLLSASAG